MSKYNAVVVGWDNNVEINVEYVTRPNLDEPGEWVVSSWWIESLVVNDTSHTDGDLIQYLYDTMSEKHRDYIQTACEEDMPRT